MVFLTLVPFEPSLTYGSDHDRKCGIPTSVMLSPFSEKLAPDTMLGSEDTSSSEENGSEIGVHDFSSDCSTLEEPLNATEMKIDNKFDEDEANSSSDRDVIDIDVLRVKDACLNGEDANTIGLKHPLAMNSGRDLIQKCSIASPLDCSPLDTPSTRLRWMVCNSQTIITCPGVYDGLSARIAQNVGFKAMYMTGAGTTASMLGSSDLGIAQMDDMVRNADMIANLDRDGPPLIADMDTGYGGSLVIRRAVHRYARAGVAAFHIEDQVPEKRCGHLSGKEVVDVKTYLRRIRTCVYARAQIRSDIIIIARTDALQSLGYDESVARLKQARDLGADMGILEGVTSKAMAAQAVRDLAPWPLCYNSVENGQSPLITVAEAQEMGYRVMIFSFAGIAAAYTAVLDTYRRLRDCGVTGSSVKPKTIFEMCNLNEEMALDAEVGGDAFTKGV